MNYDGGYFLIKEPLIRGGVHKHTQALDNPLSDETLAAVNTIQATRWRINTWALDLMREAWVNGDLVGGLPSAEKLAMPAELPDEKWAAMTSEARSEHKAKRREIHDKNAALESLRQAFLEKLSVAEELRDRDAIWFPHFVDFRSRIYPMVATGCTPQGDDISKALLMFAEGKALGSNGLFWLCIRLANTFGQDKLTLQERAQWVIEHTEEIEDSGNNPLDGARFWTEADEPWSFLVTCREYAMAMADGKPEEFVSHLPIPLDGSCNGLQHLSAMGRDPIGAKATNLTANVKREDIYMEVAEVVKRLVSEDIAAGKPEALAWAGRIDRKTVKRAVMTTPYGVTERGIRTQLVQDGHAEEANGVSKGETADYLKDKIVSALSQTITSARDIMAWLQGVAKALADDEKPFRWTTPAGNTIQQSYYTLAQKRVSTLVGEVYLWEEDPLIGMSRKKQALAAAPNVIHSFDAAHATKTVNACVDAGVTYFAMIHDSFATHAADTNTLARILREQFVAIYREDWMAKIEEEVRSYAPDVDLPPRPALGAFDVTEVLDAPFFFS